MGTGTGATHSPSEEQQEHPFLFSHSHSMLGSQDGTGGSFSSRDPRSLHKR